MCWTKKRVDQLLHCIFHCSHHFQQELQKKSRMLRFPAAHLITPHISRKLTVLQQEVKASKLWDEHWQYTRPKHPSPSRNAHRLCPATQQLWHLLCTVVTEVLYTELRNLFVFCLWGAAHSRASWREVRVGLWSVHSHFMRMVFLLPRLQE